MISLAALNRTHYRHRESETRAKANQGNPQRFVHHRRHDLPHSGTKRHANAELGRSLSHEKRNDGICAGEREQQADHAEQRGSRRKRLERPRHETQQIPHRHDSIGRIRIECVGPRSSPRCVRRQHRRDSARGATSPAAIAHSSRSRRTWCRPYRTTCRSRHPQ